MNEGVLCLLCHCDHASQNSSLCSSTLSVGQIKHSTFKTRICQVNKTCLTISDVLLLLNETSSAVCHVQIFIYKNKSTSRRFELSDGSSLRFLPARRNNMSTFFYSPVDPSSTVCPFIPSPGLVTGASRWRLRSGISVRRSRWSRSNRVDWELEALQPPPTWTGKHIGTTEQL